MVSSVSLRDALHSAQRIQGMFIGDLAREISPTATHKGTGWIGNLVEQAVTGNAVVGQGIQDLSTAGVEIKSFGVGRGGWPIRAWEDLRLREVNYGELCSKSWHESPLIAKLRVILMVPYWRPPAGNNTCKCDGSTICRMSSCTCKGGGCECTPWCPCRGGTTKASGIEQIFVMTPFLWVPNAKMIGIFASDYSKHAERVRAGGKDPLGNLGDNFGEALRAATHGQNEKTSWIQYKSADGSTHETKTRAWMLRKGIMDRILQENLPGPWRT